MEPELCLDCPKVATHQIEDLDFCSEHYESFLGELETKEDLESHGD